MKVILLRMIGLFIALALSAAEAQADVMEINAQGARWVAGGEGQTNGAAPSTYPSARTQSQIPPAYQATVNALSARYDLSPSLIEALVWQESRWRENAISPAGARGLAQLMPGTARDLGVDPDDPYANLEGGVRYLRQQLDRFGGDIELALAAYNAGPQRVERTGGIPAIRETEAYVVAVIDRLARQLSSQSPAQSPLESPPQLPPQLPMQSMEGTN